MVWGTVFFTQIGSRRWRIELEREITSESSKAYSAAKVCVQPKSMEGCVDSVVDERFDLHGRRCKVGREASLSWQPVEVALKGRGWLSNTRRPSLLELERA